MGVVDTAAMRLATSPFENMSSRVRRVAGTDAPAAFHDFSDRRYWRQRFTRLSRLSWSRYLRGVW
jgi:hypothetical protein